ncbi:MAG: DNRLRE domain-containing protein [Verrucomicrobia bacterium]|nr:DNRLRE domain-containing protein [Verrucomicrobiota bacterium]
MICRVKRKFASVQAIPPLTVIPVPPWRDGNDGEPLQKFNKIFKTGKPVRNPFIVRIALVACLAWAGASLPAETITFGFEAGMITNVLMQDNVLLEEAPDLNRGACGSLKWSGASAAEGRVLWQLNSAFAKHIPPGGTITRAALKFVNINAASATTGSVYRVLKPWTETATTWNQRDVFNYEAWDAPGMRIGKDLAAAPFIKDQALPAVAVSGMHEFDITSELRFWMNSPSNNFGIAFIAAPNAPEIHWGDANRGAGNENEMPRLEIEFSPAAAPKTRNQ